MFPDTFHAFTAASWTITAANIDAVPESLRDAVSAGIPASVPGEATLDLMRAGLIADPFDGDNESAQQWIGDVDWTFTGHFQWSDDGASRHDLVAYGLDTVACVSLNGAFVGATENFHRTYRWDVRELLHDGENVIEVRFTSPVRFSDANEQRRGYWPHTEHHAFNQIRKPSYSFGWDWGIDVANAGIWQPIGIDSWSEVRLAEVRPLVDVLADGTGVLTTHVMVEREGHGRVMSPDLAHAGQTPVPVSVHVTGPDGKEYTAQGMVEQGRDEAAITVRIPDVQRWWPLGYGEQPLYDVTVSAGEGAVEVSSEAGAQASEPAAQWRGRVGFRTVHVDTRADETGRPFQIYVNDVPVHARGYNWIPDDAFISRVSRADYERGVADLVESNSNMVRVWGGGIYESNDLYDMCDEAGIMVWQDFMLACAAYPEDEATKREVEGEARDAIVRLCSHPSLIVWNGSNENYVAYAEWGGYKQALADDDLSANAYGYGEKPWGNYYYTHTFTSLLAELDPTHVYLPSSPMSFTKFTDANKDTDGTMHIWDAWNRVDYRVYASYTPRFADEFGYQAPPAWSTLTRVVHDEHLDPFGKQMLVHQKASGGNYKLARGMRSHLTEGDINDVSFGGVVNGKPSDGPHDWLIPTDTWEHMEDWHWACQLQQAQAMRFGVEHMRSLEPVNAGALIWQLNDDWPVVSWAAVDYDGHRKPVWYASRDFFTPRLATIQPRVSEEYRKNHSWEGVPVAADHLELVVLNDTREPVQCSWTIQRMRLDGTVLAEQCCDMMMAALAHTGVALHDDVATFDNAAEEIIVATPDGGDFARVIYNGAEVVEQHLERVPFAVQVARDGEAVVLTVTATDYVRDLVCLADKVDTAAMADTGMVSLLPGESAEIRIERASDLRRAARTADGQTPALQGEPQDYAAALRCANDLKRTYRA